MLVIERRDILKVYKNSKPEYAYFRWRLYRYLGGNARKFSGFSENSFIILFFFRIFQNFTPSWPEGGPNEP